MMEMPNSINSNKKPSLLKSIFNKDFTISAIVPIVLFTLFDKAGLTLTGIILSGGWSIGVVVYSYIKEHVVNALAVMSAVFSAIGIVGTVISKNPQFFLVAPIVQDILIAMVFLGSLFCERTLIQVIVEQSYGKMLSEKIKSRPDYKSAWRIVSVAWGILSISQASLRIYLLNSVSMSAYYTISTLYGNISVPAFIAFSMLFPKWYWSRKK